MMPVYAPCLMEFLLKCFIFFSEIDVITVEASGGNANEKMLGMLDESKGDF